jgi:hypothetical protein
MLRYATSPVFELLLSGLTVGELAITDTREPGFGSYGQSCCSRVQLSRTATKSLNKVSRVRQV